MNSKSISELLMNNIDKINDPTFYKSILRHDNNLSRFDILNRMIIEIQRPKMYDARTEDEWLSVGRSIRSKQKPVYILLPKYKVEYIDNKTDKALDKSDLTLDEISSALKYGIIRKENNIKSMNVKAVFDIRQTYNKVDEKYIIDKVHIKYSNLVKLVQSLTGCSIQKSDITYFHKKDNRFEISKMQYDEFAQAVCDIVIQYYTNSVLDDLLNNSELDMEYTDLTEYDHDLLTESMRFSIESLLGVNSEPNFEIIRHTSREKTLFILNIVDSILSDILSKLDTGSVINEKSIGYTLELARKAEVLLNIMEANTIRAKLSNI